MILNIYILNVYTICIYTYTNLSDRETAIYSYLEANGAKRIVIPHKQNRMVMFNSNLFHASDHHGRFDPSSYKYRRINIVSQYIYVYRHMSLYVQVISFYLYL